MTTKTATTPQPVTPPVTPLKPYQIIQQAQKARQQNLLPVGAPVTGISPVKADRRNPFKSAG